MVATTMTGSSNAAVTLVAIARSISDAKGYLPPFPAAARHVDRQVQRQQHKKGEQGVDRVKVGELHVQDGHADHGRRKKTAAAGRRG